MNSRIFVVTLASVLAVTSGTLRAQAKDAERVREAATVFSEIMSVPDKAIPNAILGKAECLDVLGPVGHKRRLVHGARRRKSHEGRHRGADALGAKQRKSSPAFKGVPSLRRSQASTESGRSKLV